MKATIKNLRDIAKKRGFGVGRDGKNGFYVWNETIKHCPLGTNKISEAIKKIEVL